MGPAGQAGLAPARWEFATPRNGAQSTQLPHPPAIRYGRFNVNFVEKPSLEAAAMCVSGGEAKLGLSALCGEDWRRERNELHQFPQILGGGGQ